jgi:hypothetical protein
MEQANLGSDHGDNFAPGFHDGARQAFWMDNRGTLWLPVFEFPRRFSRSA